MQEIRDWAITFVCVYAVAMISYITINPQAVGEWQAQRDSGYYTIMVTEHEQ